MVALLLVNLISKDTVLFLEATSLFVIDYRCIKRALKSIRRRLFETNSLVCHGEFVVERWNIVSVDIVAYVSLLVHLLVFSFFIN